MSTTAPTRPGDHFPLLDSIRGLAVAAVVLIHVALVSGALNGSLRGNAIQALGTYSLPILFALSGFLIYRPFARARLTGSRTPKAGPYLRNRFYRIVPAYWVALTVLGVFPGITGVLTGDFWRYYSFLQLYSLDTYESGIPQAWSLCVEVSFYLLLPMWAWAVRLVCRDRIVPELTLLAVFSALSVLVQVLSSQHLVPYLIGQTIAGQGVWLAIGMMIAVISVSDGDGPTTLRSALGRVPYAAFIASAAMSLLGLTLLVPSGGLFANVAVVDSVVATPIETIAKALLGALFVLSVLVPCTLRPDSHQDVSRTLMGHPALTQFGVISYGVYLWHLTLSSVIGAKADPFHYRANFGLDLVHFIPALDTLVLFVATISSSAAIAALSYRYIERPFIKAARGRSLARRA